MSLILYVDESGTHDKSGIKPHSGTPVVSGFIDTVEGWTLFCKDWKAVLDDHKAPYFHFTELNVKERAKKDSRFYGWKEDDCRCFIYDLAMVVTRSAVSVGGTCFAREATKRGMDPFETMFGQFFKDVGEHIIQCWPRESGPVHLFYDGEFDKRWDNIIHKISAVAALYGVQVHPVNFANKKLMLPLQAADMLAHCERRSSHKFYQSEGNRQKPRILDWILRACFENGKQSIISKLLMLYNIGLVS